MPKSNHSTKTHGSSGDADTPGKSASRFLPRSLKSVPRLLKVAAFDWMDDDEHVHRLRVSVRRALAGIHFFQELIPDSSDRWFRRKLKAILRTTRSARELDVLKKATLFGCGEREDHLQRKWLLQRQEAQRSIVALQQKLARHHKFRDHMRELKCVLKSHKLSASASGWSWCISRFEVICHQFTEANADADAFDTDSLHRLRIITKQLRYIVDIVEEATNMRRLADLKTALAEMQEQLGQIQDHISAKALLQASLQAAKRNRENQDLRDLIDSENRMISEQIAIYRTWSKSTRGRKVADCLKDVSAQIAADCRAR